MFEYVNGQSEEIVCTDEHPFYVNNLGWVLAKNSLASDEVLMYNDDVAILVSKDIEILDHEETTYNFEVEDYHTYYVGDQSILVHNTCANNTYTTNITDISEPIPEPYSNEFNGWISEGKK